MATGSPQEAGWRGAGGTIEAVDVVEGPVGGSRASEAVSGRFSAGPGVFRESYGSGIASNGRSRAREGYGVGWISTRWRGFGYEPPPLLNGPGVSWM